MSEYFIYYTESQIVCIIVFGIILVHDILNVDRQEKQIKYDRALIAFMLYFLSDAVWAAGIAGVIKLTYPFAVFMNFLNFILMANILYSWHRYVMAAEQVANREHLKKRFIAGIPIVLSGVALAITFIVAPHTLLSEDMKPTMLYNAFLGTVPIVYLIAVLFYSITKAAEEKNPMERKKHLYVGLFPIICVGCGLFQLLVLPNTPVFCFSCTILMLIFNMFALDSMISLDPLTGLNNKGHLLRYVAQDSNMRREGRYTYVVMFDVNDFKKINDRYGHSEGDHALILIAQGLRKAIGGMGMPIFLARYGGDEFIIIAHPKSQNDITTLISEARRCVEAECKQAETPYMISLAAGAEMIDRDNYSFQECLTIADQKLYADKKALKAENSVGSYA